MIKAGGGASDSAPVKKPKHQKRTCKLSRIRTKSSSGNNAVKYDILVDHKPILLNDETDDLYPSEGWRLSRNNPENIVNGYSHIWIKEQYKLRGYTFNSGGNGMGRVFAIPKELDLPKLNITFFPGDDYFFIPTPHFALKDFMEAISGDKSPNSYLQAAVAYHELLEYGAMWHLENWRSHSILPFEADVNSDYTWEMISEEPEFIEPHFYIDEKDEPVVIFYTIKFRDMITFNRFTHVFKKDGYCLSCYEEVLGTAGFGYIY